MTCTPRTRGLGGARPASPGPLTLVLVLASGCMESTSTASPDLPPEGFTSGSRLRAEVFDGATGVRGLIRWYDQATDEFCAPHRTSDGQTRCTPVPIREELRLFADAACTRPAIRHLSSACPDTADAPPRHFISVYAGDPYCYTPSTFGGGAAMPDVHVYALGQQVPMAYTHGDSGECIVSDPIEGTWVSEYYALETVDVGRFARFEHRTVPLAHGLAALVLDGDDGAQQTLEVFDSDRGATCDERLHLDPKLGGRCVPMDQVGGPLGLDQFYVDDACTTPADVALFFHHAECPDTFDMALRTEVDACGVSSHALQRLGQETAIIYRWLDSAGACTDPFGTPPDYRFQTLGAPVKPEELVPLPVTRVGDGALTTDVWTDANGVAIRSVRPGAFIETATGEPCTPQRIGGVLRCAAMSSLSVQYFTNATCLQPVVIVEEPPATCEWSRPRRVVGSEPTEVEGCYRDQLYEIGAEVTEAVPHCGSPDSCGTNCGGLVPPPPGFRQRYHLVGPPISWSALPEVARYVE